MNTGNLMEHPISNDKDIDRKVTVEIGDKTENDYILISEQYGDCPEECIALTFNEFSRIAALIVDDARG